MTKNKKEKKRKNPYRVKWGRIVVKGGILATLTIGVGGAYYVHSTLKSVPTITEAMLESDSSSNLYASDGTLLYSSAKNRRQYIPYEETPKKYIDLLLATEDREFFTHEGFNPKGVVNAGISLVKEKLGKGKARGGSGIEQQLIKLSAFSTLEQDRTIDRKIKEMFLALQLNKNYSKERILEFYVNKIFMGENAYGARTISYVYFNKDLADLTLSQLAIIAGLGQAPSAYNLYDNPDLVRERRDTVLQSALDSEVITEAEFIEAKGKDVKEGLVKRYSQAIKVDKLTGRHNSFVSSALYQVKEMGYDLELTPLQIYTTLDREVEGKVKAIVDKRDDLFQDKTQQAAVSVVDPSTGFVLSEVGGRKSNMIDGFNRASSSNRSTGSAIKPILDYGPAVEYFNWGTNKVLDGSPYTYKGTNITAYDYGGTTHGNSTMKVALRQSYNTPAIRTLDEVGQEKAYAFLRKLGIVSPEPLTASRALGLGVSPTKMASALGTFGQGGVYHKTTYIKSLKFPDGSVKKIKYSPTQAMRESTAYVVTSMLKGVVSESGTMEKAKIDGVVQAAKSGTVGYDSSVGAPAYASMDLWHVGYTKSLSIAVWQGYDKPLKHFLTQDYSLNRSVNLYTELMKELTKGRDNSDWKMPKTVSHLGGTGLSADYVPNDSPPVEREFTVPTSFEIDREKYQTFDRGAEEISLYTKKSTKVSTPPKDWKLRKWEEELEEERTRFYEEHKDDIEEAENFGREKKDEED